MSDDDEKPPQGDLFTGIENPHAPGTEARSRYEEMRTDAIEFHRAHPRVWDLFVKFTLELASRGFANGSVNMIFERIRWETAEARVDQSQAFKLNNNHRPFYARAFMRKHPGFAGFFRTRRQTSKSSPATGLPPLGPDDFD